MHLKVLCHLIQPKRMQVEILEFICRAIGSKKKFKKMLDLSEIGSSSGILCISGLHGLEEELDVVVHMTWISEGIYL